MVIKRILVPVDFSDDSLKALAYARDIAKAFGAELLLLYVVEPVYYATPADMYVTTPNMTMLLDEQRKIGTTPLRRLITDLEKKKQRVRGMVKTGSPGQVIADTAKSVRADLIVIATHGRSGLAHLFMGSVSEKVVRHASCPVLTVRRGTVKVAKRKSRRRGAARLAKKRAR